MQSFNNSQQKNGLTFYGHGHCLHFTTENRVQVVSFPVTRYRHAGGEESDVPNESEDNSEYRIGAENLYRTERTNDANPK